MKRIYKNTDLNFPISLLPAHAEKLVVKFFTRSEKQNIQKTNDDIIDNHILLTWQELERLDEGVLNIWTLVSTFDSALEDDSYDVAQIQNTPYYIVTNQKSEWNDDVANAILNNYYTKSEIDEALSNVEVDLSGYALADELYDLSGSVLDNELVIAAALTDLKETKLDKTDLPSLDGYATEEWVNEQLDNVSVDLTGYAKEDMVYDLSGHVLDNEVTIAAALTKLDEEKADKTDYYTKGEVDDIVSNLEVTAETKPVEVFEIVSELPDENIDDNKIYLLETPVDAVKISTNVLIANNSGIAMTTVRDIDFPLDDIYRNIYRYDGAIEVDMTNEVILTNVCYTVKFKGYSSYSLGIGLQDIDFSSIGKKANLYIGVGKLNKNIADAKPEDISEYVYYYQGDSANSEIHWDVVNFKNLDAREEYFVNIWSNGGVANIYGLNFDGQPYFALQNTLPEPFTPPTQYKEYIHVNGAWEIVGEDDLSKYLKKDEANTLFVRYESFTGTTKNLRDGISANTQNITTLSGAVEELQNKSVDLTGYATEEWVDNRGFARKKLLTQAEYDALPEKDKDTIYIITDAVSSGGGGTVNVDLSNYYTKGEVDEAIQNIPMASQFNDGLMSADDKGKLDLIEGDALGGLNYYTKSEVDELIPTQYVTYQPVTMAEYEEMEHDDNTVYVITDIPEEWIGTQAEYDALDKKYPETTYYIIEEE